jgi:hypothetical protein
MHRAVERRVLDHDPRSNGERPVTRREADALIASGRYPREHRIAGERVALAPLAGRRVVPASGVEGRRRRLTTMRSTRTRTCCRCSCT